MFLSALLEVWILGAFGKPATSLPKPSLEILHSVHLEWTRRISTWSRVQWLKKAFQYTSSSHFPYSIVSLHGRALMRFRFRCRSIARWRELKGQGQSLQGCWEASRQSCREMSIPGLRKDGGKTWKIGKRHEEQVHTSTIHLDVWWLLGNSSPTYDEPALLDQVAEPTRLTRLYRGLSCVNLLSIEKPIRNPRNAQNLRSKACTNESKAMIRELVGIHKAQA